MLLIVSPNAFVSGTSHVCVYAEAIGFVVDPLAVVYIAFGVDKFSLTTCLIVLPVTNVTRATRPLHLSMSMSQATLPLALVDSACFVPVSSLLNRCVLVVLTTKCFVAFILLEVLARTLVV